MMSRQGYRKWLFEYHRINIKAGMFIGPLRRLFNEGPVASSFLPYFLSR